MKAVRQQQNSNHQLKSETELMKVLVSGNIQFHSHYHYQQSRFIRQASYKCQVTNNETQLSDYDESHLSASLDDLEEELSATTQSISKLGAVNLTAIEEYETQLKRKEYLDAQNDDLIESIKLFEAAINKIDNDSRSKFKMIFEQVNEGLQGIFPKVFGGGGLFRTYKQRST